MVMQLYHPIPEVFKGELLSIANLVKSARRLFEAPRPTIAFRLIFAALMIVILRYFYHLVTSSKLISSRSLTLCAICLPLICLIVLGLAEREGEAKKLQYEEQGYYDKGERLTTDKEDLSYCYSERAVYFHKRGKTERAIRDLIAAIEIYPNNSEAKELLLEINGSQGEKRD